MSFISFMYSVALSKISSAMLDGSWYHVLSREKGLLYISRWSYESHSSFLNVMYFYWFSYESFWTRNEFHFIMMTDSLKVLLNMFLSFVEDFWIHAHHGSWRIIFFIWTVIECTCYQGFTALFLPFWQRLKTKNKILLSTVVCFKKLSK